MRAVLAREIASQARRRGLSSGEIPTMATVDSLSLVLVRILATLESLPPRPPGRIKGDPTENGWSIVGVVLCAVIAETALARRHYVSAVRGRLPDQAPRRFDVREAIGTHVEGDLRRDLHEVFSVRDAAVHCHPWVGHVGGRPADFVEDPSLPRDWGDGRYRKLGATRRTGHLGLSIMPTCVWRLEAFLATRVVARSVFELGRTDEPCRAWVTHRTWRWKRRLLSLAEIEQDLQLPTDRRYERRRASIPMPEDYPAPR